MFLLIKQNRQIVKNFFNNFIALLFVIFIFRMALNIFVVKFVNQYNYKK